MPCGCFGKKEKKGGQTAEEKYLPSKEPLLAPAAVAPQLLAAPAPAADPAPAPATPPGGRSEDDPDKASRRRDVVASFYSDQCELVGYKTTGSRPPSTHTSPAHVPPAATSSPASSARSSALCRAELAQKRREFFKELDPGGGRPLGTGSHTTPRRPHTHTSPQLLPRPSSTPPTASHHQHIHINGAAQQQQLQKEEKFESESEGERLQKEKKVEGGEGEREASEQTQAPLTPELQLPPDPDPPPPHSTAAEGVRQQQVEGVDVVDETGLQVERKQQYHHQVSRQSDDERAAEGSCILISEAFPDTHSSSPTHSPTHPPPFPDTPSHPATTDTPSSHPAADLSSHPVTDLISDPPACPDPPSTSPGSALDPTSAPESIKVEETAVDPASLDTALNKALEDDLAAASHSPQHSPRQQHDTNIPLHQEQPPSPPPSPVTLRQSPLEAQPPSLESNQQQLVEEESERPSVSIVGCIPKGVTLDNSQTPSDEDHQPLPPAPPTPTAAEVEFLPSAPPIPAIHEDRPPSSMSPEELSMGVAAVVVDGKAADDIIGSSRDGDGDEVVVTRSMVVTNSTTHHVVGNSVLGDGMGDVERVIEVMGDNDTDDDDGKMITVTKSEVVMVDDGVIGSPKRVTMTEVTKTTKTTTSGEKTVTSVVDDVDDENKMVHGKKGVVVMGDAAGEVDDGLGEELEEAFTNLQGLSEEGNTAITNTANTSAHLNT